MPEPKDGARLALERTGGFANIALRSSVDLDELPAPDRERYLGLIRQLDLPALATAQPANYPDGFTYHLQVSLGDQSHELSYSDGPGPEALKELTRLLVAHARRG